MNDYLDETSKLCNHPTNYEEKTELNIIYT